MDLVNEHEFKLRIKTPENYSKTFDKLFEKLRELEKDSKISTFLIWENTSFNVPSEKES